MEKIKRLLSMLLVVALIITTSLNVSIYAEGEETVNGSIKIEFRDSDEETNSEKKIFYADVYLHNVKTTAVGFKLKFDANKIKLSSNTGVGGSYEQYLIISDEFIPQMDEETGDTTYTGFWSANTLGCTQNTGSTADGYVQTEIQLGTLGNFPAKTEDNEYNENGIKIVEAGNDNTYADINENGYKICSIRFHLYDENLNFNNLNDEIISIDTNYVGSNDLGGIVALSGEQQLTSSTICYPKVVTFLDAKDSENEALATEQVTVDVTNTYEEGTGTSQATSYNTLAEGDMPEDPTSTDDTKTFAGWYYTDSEDGEQKFVADNGSNTESATKVEDNMTVYAKWNLAGDLTGDEKVNAFDLAKALYDYAGDSSTINEVLDHYGATA